MKDLRLKLTLGQALLLVDLGLDIKLGCDVKRSMQLTLKDLDMMLATIPKMGRTAMSIRRKVARMRYGIKAI